MKIIRSLSILLAALAVFGVIATEFSFGIAGEWIWQRVTPSPLSSTFFSFLTVFLPYLIVLSLMLFLAAAGVRKCADGTEPRLLHGVLPLLFLFSFLLQEALLSAGRCGRGENEFAILDRYTGGYLTAASQITSAPDYFRNFAHRLSLDAEKSNHLDVHPPGNVFFCWCVLKFCRAVPQTAVLAETLRPPDVREGLKSAFRAGAFRPLRDEPAVSAASVLLLSLSELFLAFSAVLLALSARNLVRSATPGAWILTAAAAAVLSSAAALFHGHCDVFYYFSGALILYFLVKALRTSAGPLKALFSVLAGLMTAVASACSLAFGLFLPLAGALFLARRSWRAGIVPLILFGTAALLPVAALWSYADVNLISCAYYAARNNAAFFRESARSAFLWIPWNFADLVLFAPPFSFLSAFGGWFVLRRRCFTTHGNVLVWTLAGLLVFLTVSPFSRGEMGRLLLFLFPAVLLAALRNMLAAEHEPKSAPVIAVLFSQGLLILVFRVFLKLALIW